MTQSTIFYDFESFSEEFKEVGSHKDPEFPPQLKLDLDWSRSMKKDDVAQ